MHIKQFVRRVETIAVMDRGAPRAKPDDGIVRPSAARDAIFGDLLSSVLISIARLWLAGSVAHAGGSTRYMRRNFYEFFESTNSPVAAEALRRIGELYAIEERIRGQSPALRL